MYVSLIFLVYTVVFIYFPVNIRQSIYKLTKQSKSLHVMSLFCINAHIGSCVRSPDKMIWKVHISYTYILVFSHRHKKSFPNPTWPPNQFKKLHYTAFAFCSTVNIAYLYVAFKDQSQPTWSVVNLFCLCLSHFTPLKQLSLE